MTPIHFAATNYSDSSQIMFFTGSKLMSNCTEWCAFGAEIFEGGIDWELFYRVELVGCRI